MFFLLYGLGLIALVLVIAAGWALTTAIALYGAVAVFVAGLVAAVRARARRLEPIGPDRRRNIPLPPTPMT